MNTKDLAAIILFNLNKQGVGRSERSQLESIEGVLDAQVKDRNVHFAPEKLKDT